MANVLADETSFCLTPQAADLIFSDVIWRGPSDQLPATWFFELVLGEGCSRRFIAEATGIDAERLETEPHELRVPAYLQLFEDCARHLSDPELGLRMAERVRMTDFGLLGYLAANAPNLRDLCLSVSHYIPIVSTGFGLEFEQVGGWCCLDYRDVQLDGQPARQDIAFTMGFIASQIRRLTHPEWTPSSCSLSYSHPGKLETHHRVLGPNLEFGAPRNRVIFEESLLQLKIDDADPGLFAVLRQQADMLLENVREIARSPISNQVKIRISAGLGATLPSAEAIADDLGYSVRQLHRRLTQEGTAFRVLRDEVLHLAAREALTFADSSITEISQHLGYSETSAFTRAFKRMQGVSPAEFRRSTRTGA